MSEAALRWKGRLGSLRAVGVILGIVGLVILISFALNLSTALKNEAEPQEVAISQLVSGEFANGYYVRVPGVAVYGLGYTETEDGKTTRIFYFLADLDTGDMVLIEHYSTVIVKPEEVENVTITGMTRRSPTDLKNAMEEDESAFSEADLQTNPKLYLKDGATPPSAGASLTGVIVGVVLLLLAVVPFFFPQPAFGPYPVDRTAVALTEQIVPKASGNFLRLQQVQPTVEIGKGSRKFNNAVANIVPLPGNRLMIYIHHILKSKAYGVTVRTTTSDWGAFIDQNNVRAIEPGKIYGWKDHWAVRFQYQGERGRPETLFVSFDQPGAQASLVDLLQKMGFPVSESAML